MANLIHLADELLLQIFSNLASLPLATLELPVLQLNDTPLNRWADTLASHAVNTRNFNDQIRIVPNTCKRLHDLLSPVLYKHLSLISQERGPDSITFQMRSGPIEILLRTSRLFTLEMRQSRTYTSSSSRAFTLFLFKVSCLPRTPTIRSSTPFVDQEHHQYKFFTSPNVVYRNCHWRGF